MAKIFLSSLSSKIRYQGFGHHQPLSEFSKAIGGSQCTPGIGFPIHDAHRSEPEEIPVLDCAEYVSEELLPDAAVRSNVGLSIRASGAELGISIHQSSPGDVDKTVSKLRSRAK